MLYHRCYTHILYLYELDVEYMNCMCNASKTKTYLCHMKYTFGTFTSR